MFASIDRILFPNECPVLEVQPGTRYVYPIFKNGSSSLFANKNFRILSPAEVKNLDVIEVFVRDPHERFLSGVQTYLKKLPDHLNKKTMLFVIENYLYLNRHYCPQIYWLLNLQRFTTAKLHIRDMSQLNTICATNLNKSIPDPDIAEYFADKILVNFFNEMDEVLTVNLINQTVTFDHVLVVLKNNYGTLYQDTFDIAKNLVDVLS